MTTTTFTTIAAATIERTARALAVLGAGAALPAVLETSDALTGRT